MDSLGNHTSSTSSKSAMEAFLTTISSNSLAHQEIFVIEHIQLKYIHMKYVRKIKYNGHNQKRKEHDTDYKRIYWNTFRKLTHSSITSYPGSNQQDLTCDTHCHVPYLNQKSNNYLWGTPQHVLS